MKTKKLKLYMRIFINFILVATVGFGAAGVFLTAARLTLDAKAIQKTEQLVSIEMLGNITRTEAEFLLRTKTRSDSVKVVIERVREQRVYQVHWEGDVQKVASVVVKDTVQEARSVALVTRYGNLYVVGLSAVGICFASLGALVRRKQPKNEAAQLFGLTLLMSGLMIFTSQSRFGETQWSIESVIHLVYIAAYTLTPALFVYFVFMFPEHKLSANRLSLVILLGIAFLLVFFASKSFLSVIAAPDSDSIRTYYSSFNLNRWFFTLALTTAIARLTWMYGNEQEEASRRRLRWMLLGLYSCGFGFIALSLLPTLVFGSAFIPDELSVGLALLMCSMLTIAILRYRFLDIDLIFNRFFVLSLVLSLSLALFIGVSVALTPLFSIWESIAPYLASSIAMLAVLGVFIPLKNKAQELADQFLFKTQYRLKRASESCLFLFQHATDEVALADALCGRLIELLHVERVGIFFVANQRKRLELLSERGFDTETERVFPYFQTACPDVPISLPSLLEEDIDQQLVVRPKDVARFEKFKLALLMPICSEQKSILGYIGLGQKVEQLGFNAEEVNLLKFIASQTAAVVLHLRLQRELALKSEEATKLREISEMKSYFVSSVSHDLRTPLTSIKLFAEMLATRTDDETSKKYLAMIEGESDRLSKMAANVLSYAKSEKGALRYRFEVVDLNELLLEIVGNLSYQLQLGGFELEAHFGDVLFIKADKPEISQAVENIISNAIKYSGDSRRIILSTERQSALAVVSIQDFGIGISEQEINMVFEPFFRSSNDHVRRVGGAGLGLALVRNTIHAHGGTIQVKSQLGRGTIFELHLPIIEQ